MLSVTKCKLLLACRRLLLAFGLLLAVAHSGLVASAEKTPERISVGGVRIGVLTDMKSAYRDLAGSGSVLAARMAIEDFGGTLLGAPIRLVFADHENSPAVAARIARDWMQKNKVDLVVDVPNSNAALEVVKAATEFNRIAIISAAGSDRLTNEECSNNSIHWTYDTRAVTNATARTIIKNGGDSWYFVTADYLFGHSLESATTAVVQASGGTVLGATRHPFPSNTYANIKAQAAGILAARDSKAKVIALASTGSDAVNAIKLASRFGIASKRTLAGLSLFITDVHAVGLYEAQDLFLTTAFYWDLDEATRRWSSRFFERHKSMPTMTQAGVYSAVSHYLKAVKAVASDEPTAVMAKMKAMPVNDFFAKNGVIRADGRMVHDMYLMQVKKPAESKYPWDYYHVREVIPGDLAFAPLSESRCPLLHAAPK